MSDAMNTLREALAESVRLCSAYKSDPAACAVMEQLTRAEAALNELEALLADAISGLDQALHILAAAKSTTAEEA